MASETIVIPQLSAEQKLGIRDIQVQILNLREQSRICMENAMKLDQQLVQQINALANSLNADVDTIGFSIETLSFYLKEKP